MGGISVVLGVAVVARTYQEQTTPEALLLVEASRPPGHPIAEQWTQWGCQAIPSLCQALGRQESAVGRYLRLKLNGVAVRFDRPGLFRPYPGEVRSAAARILSSLGPTAEAAIPSLIRAVELGSARDEATLALLKLGPAASNAVPILRAQIRDPRPRNIACRALLRIGAPREAWEELRADPRPFARVTGQVGLLLSAGQTNAALELLAEAAARPETYVWAGRLLRDFGPEAAPVSGRLARGLRLPNPVARQFTAELLGDLGTGSSGVVEPLTQALAAEPERDARLMMIYALGQMGRAASNALPQLEQFRYGADEEQIQFARDAVGKIQP